MGFLCYRLEESLFEVDFSFHILRLLAVLTILILFSVLVISFIGADFTVCCENSVKKSLMRLSGWLMLVSGKLEFFY